jgi:hypothetical protein
VALLPLLSRSRGASGRRARQPGQQLQRPHQRSKGPGGLQLLQMHDEKCPELLLLSSC